MNKILITGSTGFVGQKLCKKLILDNYSIREAVRSNSEKRLDKREIFNIGDIDKSTNWSASLKDIDCVIHCAARAHVMNENKLDTLATYRKVNVDGTRNLAEQCAKAGVKRLIFLSSIKVNGEKTKASFSFRHDDNPKPEDAYGITKWEAELALQQVSKKYEIEIVIIRAPLVYGPNVKGNFLKLINLASYRIPLPISKVNNIRSFVSVENLIDLISCCIKHPAAAGKIFLVSDNKDMSTPELIKKIGKAMGKSQFFIPLPVFILRFLCAIIGKSSEIERLVSNLQVDCNNTFEVLGWRPPENPDDAILKTIKWHLNQND